MKYSTYNIMMLLLAFLLFISKFEYCYSNNIACLANERIALLQFKDSLIDKSNRLSSWTGLDCCKWEGVLCSPKTGHVSKLDLHNAVTFDFEQWYESGFPSNYSNNCLGGEINHSLVNLTHLEYLDLSLNHFSGIQIPEFLGSFKKLRYLNLSSSGFAGNIPAHLGNLSSMEYLHLGAATEVSYLYDPYYLTIENMGWLANLSSLKSLDLSTISIQHSEDWLPTINKLVSLSSFNLAYCKLNVTTALSHINSTSLISLNLRGNSLDSRVLLWLSNLTRLEHLNLAQNYVNSSMLDIFEHLSSLKFLDLSANDFSGSLTPFCKLHNLVSMVLSNTDFQGLIPHCLGNLTSLTSLDLSSNSLEGPIPSSIGNMTSLTSLQLSFNRLEGPIPSSISRLCELQSLDLSVNQLTGMLTDSIGAPTGCLSYSLQYLFLGYNYLTGQLPNQLYKYKNLKGLDLSSNSFSGTIADSLGNMSMLSRLSISDNKFSGSIPLSLGELTNLRALYISTNNSLFFNVSSNWIPPFQLRRMQMSSIKIGPNFPQWLRTQTNLIVIIMSNASISDAIPLWFGKFFLACIVIDLSQNHISGELPYVDNLKEPNCEYLSLSHNNLTGGIPKWICSFKSLFSLDFSTNKLSGEILSCLGELQYLYVLDLGSNNLHGRIPHSLGSLYLLKSLHLGNNKLEGKLPSSLHNLKSLMILDLSKNEFKDVIPSWIGERLSSLEFLIFHANKFYGDIPLQLCQLQDLQILNLANNNISGCIPQCFNNFSRMISDNNPALLDYTTMFPSTVYEDLDYIRMFPRTVYEDRISEYTKGLELQYTKSLRFLRSIDLSRNHLIGMIPVELTRLCLLENLNLSRNHLSGRIPKSIGNLSKLESLDLSNNMLSGTIPPSLSALNFLSYMNLSFNKLCGRIPTGNQLQTLNDPSIYIGNEGLCGTPLLRNCTDDKLPSVDQPTETSYDDDHEFFMWFYAGLGPGFFVGFIGVLTILLFKRSWRYAYFKFLGLAYNKILSCLFIKG